MDIGALRASPIGQLVSISGTDWRTGSPYRHFAYVPDALPDAVAVAEATWRAVGTVEDQLARLDRTARRLGRVATGRAVESLYERGAASAPALQWATQKPLTAALVNGLQAALVHRTRGDWGDAGRLRPGEVFLAARPGPVERSRFVPAPHGVHLEGAFEDWIRWQNRTDSYLSAVVQAGLAHYQFETLHPYSDGNGRVGRLAIVLTLVRRGILRYPILAVSPWLDRHKAEYQDALLELSHTGDWNRWLAFFATAIGGAADATQHRLQELLEDWRHPSRPPHGRPGSGARGRPTRARSRPASLAAALLAACAVSACGGSSSSKTAAGVKGPSEVLAAPISTAGANPFTPSAGTDKAGVKPPAAAASTTGGPATYVASLPGLYGGTRNYKSCDAEKLVTFLQHSPDKAAAWASTLGISTTNIPQYVSGLTPVLLRTDTRVTNHGYVNGVADPIQSVLEAGTAVLVNQYGEPVVKCYCGNPLTPPELLSQPVYTGPLWPSFTTTNITIIQQSTTIINTYTLFDPDTGTEFKRKAGLTGTDGPYINAGPKTPTPGGPTTPSSPSQPPSQTSTSGQTSTRPAENPSVSLSPNPVVQGGTVTLGASGFAPGASLQITVNRPDGGTDHFSLTAGGDGSASFTFPNTGGGALGTYSVTVTDLGTG
ncbi:MAG: Fic family protein, partial [Solirubrobacterales bacterium]|nr:Fic family protein [Solirubrobacterales bacterium]